MDSKIYNSYNFHKHTYCVFREAAFSEIENRNPDFQSKSGSSYYFNENGVYRLSNHWSRVANCRWRLESTTANTSRTKLGFAKWTEFHRDNETEKLYCITVDYENKTVNYQHKANVQNTDAVFRTASETTKLVKQIRNLLETDAWAKYMEAGVENLRKTIIEKLISTHLSLAEIKRNL